MEIPVWPAFRSLDISDKSRIDSIFMQLQPRISELTFAGLYLFRNAHEYCLSLVGDSVVVIGNGYDGTSYCLPPLCGNIAVAGEMLLNAGMEIYGVEEQFLCQYVKKFECNIVEDRDSYDYLYLHNDLATLPGNIFHKKKNRINYFAARHSYEVQRFSVNHQHGCLRLLDEWGKVTRVEGKRSFGLEMDATEEALKQVDHLGLEGVVVTVEGDVRAFSLGERLNRDTVVCHFEKADPFMEGLSQLVNREFANLLFADCNYINREQDLGEQGLRNAKLSYHPVELVKKIRVRKK